MEPINTNADLSGTAPILSPAMDHAIEGVVALFHRFRAVAEEIHGQGELSAGRRGILRELAKDGPRTVPDMARRRPVSRQHIQMLVNGLLGDGLVELVENPAHRRSRHVRLTGDGRELATAMDRRELALFEGIPLPVSVDALEVTAETLHSLREFFESPEWTGLLASRLESGAPSASVETLS